MGGSYQTKCPQHQHINPMPINFPSFRFILCFIVCFFGVACCSISVFAEQPDVEEIHDSLQETGFGTLTDREAEEIHRYYNQFCAVAAPRELFEYLRKTYKGRHYRAASLFLPTVRSPLINTETHRRGTLSQWAYIADRLDPVMPQFFPRDENEKILRKKYYLGKEEVEVVFVKEDSDQCWHLAPESLDETRNLYQKALGLPPVYHKTLSQFFPVGMFHIRCGLSYFQWTILGIGFLLGFPLFYLIQVLLYCTAKCQMSFFKRKTVSSELRKLFAPIAAICVVWFWYWLLHLVVFDPRINDIAFYVCSIFVTVLATLIGLQLIDYVAEKFRKKYEGDEEKGIHLSDIVIPLVSRLAKILVVCLGAAALADAFGLPVVAVLSGMGIGGVAIAFAAKETIGDFFGSITVLIDRPFVVGDWITMDDHAGMVESIGLRSTRIRTYENGLVTIPNNVMTTAIINNDGKNYGYRTFLGIEYGTPLTKIDEFCEGIRQLIHEHPTTDKNDYIVELNEMKESALNILIDIHFICPNVVAEANSRSQFIHGILELAEKLDVKFAYPTQTLHVFGDNTHQKPTA